MMGPMHPATLALLADVSTSVPAYRRYLADNGHDPDVIAARAAAGGFTTEEFAALPLMTKADYVRAFPLGERVRGGDLASCSMVAVSSGSTGVPTYWPRRTVDEQTISARFDAVFRDAFHTDRHSTLAVICFPLGTWVGGMFTTSCVRLLADQGCRILTVTPGNNPEEILRVVGDLAPQFDQTVLCGYPPFLKGVVDAGTARGLRWADHRLRLVMAGEVYSEDWRSLMGDRLGIDDIVESSAALYGTADAGVLGNETPLSVTIRRWLATHPDVARDLFGESRLPTLVQYDPAVRDFEVIDGTLAFSGDNGVPLIRYHIADTGGVATYEDLLTLCRSHDFDPLSALPADTVVHELPFVWVFGRLDFTVSFFGANVFPENVTIGLEQEGIREWVTGKFVMESREDDDGDRHLHVTVELAIGEEATDERTAAVAASIRSHTERVNSEFANYVPAERRTPTVHLLPHGHPDWFPVGVKHRYTRA